MVRQSLYASIARTDTDRLTLECTEARAECHDDLSLVSGHTRAFRRKGQMASEIASYRIYDRAL